MPNSKQYTYASFDIETTGLSKSSKIIAIGAAKTFPSGGKTGETWYVQDNVKDSEGVKHPTKKQQVRIVEKLVDFLEPGDNLFYSFNGVGFDLPMIWSTARLKDDYGELARRVHDLLIRHRDIQPILENQLDLYGNLDKALQEFGLQHNGDINGGDVPRYYQKNRLEEINKYLKEDVQKTHKLARKVRTQLEVD